LAVGGVGAPGMRGVVDRVEPLVSIEHGVKVTCSTPTGAVLGAAEEAPQDVVRDGLHEGVAMKQAVDPLAGRRGQYLAAAPGERDHHPRQATVSLDVGRRGVALEDVRPVSGITIA